jgi:hypothetical protein
VVRVVGALASRIDAFVAAAPPGIRIALDTAALGLPATIAPGSTMSLGIRITPLVAGPFVVTIAARGDADGDTVAVVTGNATICATPAVTATDHDFDSVLVSRRADGVVRVINTGQGAITVSAMRIVDDIAGEFALVSPRSPFVIGEGESHDVAVAFTPASQGPKSARVEFTTNAGVVSSTLRGVGVVLRVPVRIPRTYHGEPGDATTFAIVLDEDTPVVGADSIDAVVGFNSDTLRAGPIAALRFLVRISPLDTSELPLTMPPAAPWLSFATVPGLFFRDPWCGVHVRMFTFTEGSFALRPVTPNPVRGDASVEFAIPVDGRAVVSIVDELGVERIRLADSYFRAGGYHVAIHGNDLSPGVYFIRLLTSEHRLLERFVVE